MPNVDLASALVYYLVFLYSTTVHEAAHAWAAKIGGDLTAYHGGQVSLDPRPHIKREPIGMLVLPIVSALLSGWPMGFASAPYDPRWAMRYPKRAALMALAGPGANLLLVVLAGIAIRGGILAGVFHAPESVNFDHIVSGRRVGALAGGRVLPQRDVRAQPGALRAQPAAGPAAGRQRRPAAAS